MLYKIHCGKYHSRGARKTYTSREKYRENRE